MPGRMLCYRSEIILSYPDDDIRQYLIYIGKERLQMADKIQQSGLDYHRLEAYSMQLIDPSITHHTRAQLFHLFSGKTSNVP